MLPIRIKMIHLKMKTLELSQHFSHYESIGIFPDAQGQLTPQSLIGFCRITSSFKILWLSSFPARIVKIQSQMKDLEWSQEFTHYNSMGAIYCHGNPVLIQPGPNPNAAILPSQWCSRWNFILIRRLVSETFMFESVEGRTPARVTSYKLTDRGWSEELINQRSTLSWSAHMTISHMNVDL